MGSKPPPLNSEERASASRTTRWNASRSCSMSPNPRHRVGAWFSRVQLSPQIGASRWDGAGSCRSASDPKTAVPGRMTRDARGRDRPREAPPAVVIRREGSASAPGSDTARFRDRTCATGVSGDSCCTARCIGTSSAEAGAPHRASPPIGSPARTAGTDQSLSSSYGFASARSQRA